VLPYYEQLVDADYEEGRAARSIQARKILEFTRKFNSGGRLLDIGAGTGFLVEQALQMGYSAQGIEPSAWLHATARRHGLPVEHGTFPHPAISGLFDVITLIDVIEHVSHPLELLKAIAKSLAPGGTAIVVTPDVSSLAACFLSERWWHFRIAHIGYFNKATLFFALDQAGLRPMQLRRPRWYLPLGYLWERTHRYLPPMLRFSAPRALAHTAIPVNLRDSWLVACTRKA
jgi:SAM-dependent methyltransferase